MVCLSYIRYHGVLLWNETAVDWLSVAIWFGTYSCFGARMQTRSLVRPLFVAKSTWFGIPNFSRQKKSGWDIVSETMMCMTTMTCRFDLGWWKSPCGVLGHLYQR